MISPRACLSNYIINIVAFNQAILHVGGSAQLYTYKEFSTITYNATNTLEAVPEMLWGTTVASLAGSRTLDKWNYDWDSAGGLWSPLNGTTANVTRTITSNFGRFGGATQFNIGLTLAGMATSTYQSNQPLDWSGNPLPSDDVIFGYDGTAQLYYEYDYAPAAVPEPATMPLLSLGWVGLAAIRRKL